MKKNYKRILVAILIMALIVAFMPFSLVTADGGITPDSTESINTEITHNGVTLTMYEIMPESTYGFVDVTVEGTGLTEELAGFSGTIYFEGGHTPVSVEKISDCLLDVETTKITNNFISFIAEKDELDNDENEATIRIKYQIDWTTTPQSEWAVGFGNISGYTEFVTADSKNNCYKPFDDLELNHTLQLALQCTVTYPISVPVGKENITKIDNVNKRIYVKLDGVNSGYASVESLLNSIEINLLDFDYDELTWKSEKGTSTHTIDLDDPDYGTANIEDIDRIICSTCEGDFEYEVYQMGDVWYETERVGGAINISDVMKLRLAIIGDETTLSDENFEVRCSDVNFSNSELGTLGDIGDVISIRQRILETNTWVDTE